MAYCLLSWPKVRLSIQAGPDVTLGANSYTILALFVRYFAQVSVSPISSYGLQLAAKLPQTRIFHSIKYRFQGTFHTCKVVKRMFEPTLYHNLLRVKCGKCSNTLFTTFPAINITLKFIFYFLNGVLGISFIQLTIQHHWLHFTGFIQVFECSSVRVSECSSVRVFKCSSLTQVQFLLSSSEATPTSLTQDYLTIFKQ